MYTDKNTLIKLAEILIDGDIIYYSLLAEKLMAADPSLGDINPRNLDRPLGALSDACKAEGLPLISVLVVSKNGETILPGDGYFSYFYPSLPKSKWENQFMHDLNKKRNCSNWQPLLDHLNRLP